MQKNPGIPEGEPHFVMEDGDRFRKIVSSGDILLPKDPGAVSVITLFAIRRKLGRFDLVIVHKLFRGDEVSKTLMKKEGLDSGAIDFEIELAAATFKSAIRAQAVGEIEWDELDLSGVAERDGQIAKIEEWGGIKIHPVREKPPGRQ